MNEVRIAIVGMGIGKANALGYIHHPRARVVALCDVLEARMDTTATELGLTDVKKYTSYEEMSRDQRSMPSSSAYPTSFMCRWRWKRCAMANM